MATKESDYDKAVREGNERHLKLYDAHRDELLKHGAMPRKTVHNSNEMVSSETHHHGSLISHDNGKEFHHRWYDENGTSVNSPKYHF